MRSRAGRKPSHPNDILRRAREREEEQARAAERALRRQADPATWGVSAELKTLPTSRPVRIGKDAGGRVARAKRMDAFDSLLAAGGLTIGQHEAAARLIRDWATMLGLAGAPEGRSERVASVGQADQVTLRMIQARDNVNAVLSRVGLADRRLLAALVEPIIMTGELTAWRDVVGRVAGESERNCQGSVVRQACENLRLAYERLETGTQRA
jgi:hypothetical protein